MDIADGNTVPVTEETPLTSGGDIQTEHPKGQRIPLLKPVSVISQVYKWYPTGLRVVMNLPIVGNDKSFLFLLRAHPLILTPAMCQQYFNNAANVYGNMFPFKYTTAKSDPFNGGKEYINILDNSINFVQHSPPPLATYLALSHARWRGGIDFSFRTTSQFTNQANVYATRIPAILETMNKLDGSSSVSCDDGTTQTNYVFGVQPNMDRGSLYANTFQTNSWVNADLAVQRHLEVTIPFEHPCPTVDTRRMLWQACQSAYDQSGGAFDTFSQFLAFGLKGGIDAGSGPQQIQMELYARLHPEDTQFLNYTGLPYFLTEEEQYGFMDDYNMGPGKNSIIFPNNLVRNNNTAFWLSSETSSSVAPPSSLVPTGPTPNESTITPTTTPSSMRKVTAAKKTQPKPKTTVAPKPVAQQILDKRRSSNLGKH